MRNESDNPKVILPFRYGVPEHSEDLKKKIAVRAYEIFERRGRVLNHDVDDWLEAESEVLCELN